MLRKRRRCQCRTYPQRSGRKSDVNDATWIADLMAHGLIQASFVPPAPIQELRDLSRTRKQLGREIVQHTQRIQKVLEDANLKIASVATDIMGVSGRAIVEALISGETDPDKLADLTRGRLKASRATIVKSGNMSLGVNLLAALVKQAARALDVDFDIDILEMHHNKKVDAPSGTALLLGQAAAAGRNIDLAKRSDRARDGHTGARKSGDIGFAVLRGGTVVGDHSVIFAGPSERIELTHRAEDRMIFARGAVKAALWAREQKPGLYSMADVLGLGAD